MSGLNNSDGNMRCITVRQPWASLLVMGVKCVEGRSWTTSHRGILWIHAGQAKPSRHDLAEATRLYPGSTLPHSLPFGCIIGCVTIIDIMDNDAYERKYNRNDCAFQKAWVCSNPRILVEPIKFSGKLRIYDLPDNVLEILRTAPFKCDEEKQTFFF